MLVSERHHFNMKRVNGTILSNISFLNDHLFDFLKATKEQALKILKLSYDFRRQKMYFPHISRNKVGLFLGISTFVGYLMPKLFS